MKQQDGNEQQKKKESLCLQVGKIEEKILSAIARNQLLPPGATVVAAVSGGADSLALLHFLHTHRHLWRIHVAAAHLDHCLRGEASADDRKAVIDYCSKENIPLFSAARDVRQWAEQKKEGNTEAAARAVRYDFLRQAARICGGAVIATAHHLDDQAETILMHLLRGSGIQGLCGMKAKTEEVIRPFLGLTKEEILTYCAAYDLSYCTDASNFDTAYLRNRIRLELLPLLQRYNPQISAALANVGEICAEENDYLAAETKAAYEKIAPNIGREQGIFNSELFEKLPVALQRRVLQYFFRMFQDKKDKITQRVLSFDAIEQIRALAVGESLTLAGDILCRREEMQFVFSYLAREKKGRKTGFCYSLAEIKEPVVLTFPRYSYYVQVMQGDGSGFCQDNITVIDKNRLFIPLGMGKGMVIRSRREGDILSPQGMAGRMKLKKYFINEKIPASLRDNIPLLAKDGEIFWVIPARFGNIAGLTGKNIAGNVTGGWYLTAAACKPSKTDEEKDGKKTRIWFEIG